MWWLLYNFHPWACALWQFSPEPSPAVWTLVEGTNSAIMRLRCAFLLLEMCFFASPLVRSQSRYAFWPDGNAFGLFLTPLCVVCLVCCGFLALDTRSP